MCPFRCLLFAVCCLLFAAIFLSSCRNPANPNVVTVSFDTAGGTPAIECQIIRRGGTVEPVDPPSRAGHRFLGWYTDQYWAYRWDFDNGVVRQDITLFARWNRAGGGGGGGGGAGGSLLGGGDTPIRVPGSANKTVYEQLEWMHDPINAGHIQGGLDRVYIVTAYDPLTLANAQTINSNTRWINFTAANPGDPVRVRIVSNPPGSQWDIQMGAVGIRLEVANDNILELQDVALSGLSGLAAIPQPIVRVQSDGTLVMREGSVIRNNNSGRGVHVNGGTFRMYNGATIRNNAGGVYVTGSSGTFTMVGGTIGGIGGQNSALAGGGVMVSGGAEFEMTGGTISHNSATSGGGGVHLTGTDTTFLMTGGTITGNTTTTLGGGVDVQANTTFIMEGGIIGPGNTANGWGVAGGGGVHLYGVNAEFRMYGGEISGNSAVNSFGGGIHLRGGTTTTPPQTLSRFIMHGGTISGNNANNGHGGGVNASGASRIEMHGGTIGPSNTALHGGGVSLNLIFAFAGAVGTPGMNFTMHGGTISGNHATNQGGGVWLSNGSRFRIYGPGMYTGGANTGGAVLGAPSNTSPFGAAVWNSTGGNNGVVFINSTSFPASVNFNNTIP